MIMKMMLVCCLNWRCWRPRSLLVIHTRWRHISWGGMVWCGIILAGAPSFSKNPHGARTFMEDLMWRDKNRQRLNQTDIECRWWYSRSNLWIWMTKPPQTHNTVIFKKACILTMRGTRSNVRKVWLTLQGYWQSQKNPVSASAMLTGKFLLIRKVFATSSLLTEEFPDTLQWMI